MSLSGDHETCEKLLGAARLLFARSGLFDWHGSRLCLRFKSEPDFEAWLTSEYRGDKYARYHAWMQLVVGGENLVKAWGVCTQNKPAGLPKKSKVYSLPPASETDAWIKQVAQNKRSGETLDDFGTLGRWVNAMLLADSTDIRKAGVYYLKECRNREAHQYIATMRQSRYRAIPPLSSIGTEINVRRISHASSSPKPPCLQGAYVDATPVGYGVQCPS